jgi:hypothetical protein
MTVERQFEHFFLLHQSYNPHMSIHVLVTCMIYAKRLVRNMVQHGAMRPYAGPYLNPWAGDVTMAGDIQYDDMANDSVPHGRPSGIAVHLRP